MGQQATRAAAARGGRGRGAGRSEGGVGRIAGCVGGRMEQALARSCPFTPRFPWPFFLRFSLPPSAPPGARPSGSAVGIAGAVNKKTRVVHVYRNRSIEQRGVEAGRQRRRGSSGGKDKGGKRAEEKEEEEEKSRPAVALPPFRPVPASFSEEYIVCR